MLRNSSHREGLPQTLCPIRALMSSQGPLLKQGSCLLTAAVPCPLAQAGSNAAMQGFIPSCSGTGLKQCLIRAEQLPTQARFDTACNAWPTAVIRPLVPLRPFLAWTQEEYEQDTCSSSAYIAAVGTHNFAPAELCMPCTALPVVESTSGLRRSPLEAYSPCSAVR